MGAYNLLLAVGFAAAAWQAYLHDAMAVPFAMFLGLFLLGAALAAGITKVYPALAVQGILEDLTSTCRRDRPLGSARPEAEQPDRHLNTESSTQRRAGRPPGHVLARPPGKARPDARDREEEPWQHSAPSTSSTRAGKRVLVRVDFNVPMQDGEVTDATRIERAATTLKELSDKGAKVIALSHFGRPEGQARELDVARADRAERCPGAGPAGRVRAGLRRASRPSRRRCAAGRRGGAAREPALPHRRGEERPGLRRPARELGRRLRQRRLLGLAPRPRLDHGLGRASARLRRPADAGRAGGAGRGAGRAQRPDGGADRRRQGLDQARPCWATCSAGSTCW